MIQGEREGEEEIDFTTDFELQQQEAAREAEGLEDFEEDYIAEYKKNKIDEQIIDFLDQSKYKQLIDDIIIEQKTSLEVDYRDLHNFIGDLERRLLENPKVFLKYFQQVLYQLDSKWDWNYFKESKYFSIQISNYVNRKEISKIRVDLINQFITFRGIVQRQSEIRPYIQKFYMRCPNCKTGKYTAYPDATCYRCDKEKNMIPIKDKHIYTDSILIRVQELNEDLKGALPKYVECVILGDLVDKVKAGGKITVTGFVGLREVKGSMNVFLKYFVVVHVNNVEPITTNDLKLELEQTRITEEDEKEILQFKKLPRHQKLEILQNSYAPAVYGHLDVKLVLELCIIGGGKILVDGVLIRERIHTLLIGDPSISKTQLLKFGELISVGSMYASGRGTSATGLTAAAIKDNDGTFSLQPGYLIFANNTVLWFDEADKLKPEVLSHLHQSMEEGQVSLAKGGQIATLNANTTIVSAMNPKGSRYALDLSVIDNLSDIPDSFLTRFDFIFIMLDKINREGDKMVSRHIDSIIIDRIIPNYGIDIMSTVKLRKYLEYVKLQDIDPSFTPTARTLLEEYYIDKRQKSTPEAIAISARMKQGMLRACRALARLLLDRVVDSFHVDIVIKLIDTIFETVLKDEDGNYNISQIEGKTSGKLRGTKIIIEICKRLMEDFPKNKLPKGSMMLILSQEYKVTQKKAFELVDTAVFEGIIRTSSENHIEFLH